MKTLQWTIKERVSNSNCNGDQNYNPDEEMMKAITLKSGCNLPWSNFQIDRFNYCSTEKDYHNYFTELRMLQENIQKFPKKCKYDTWKASPLYDTHYNRNDNSTGISLIISLDGQKVNLKTKTHPCTKVLF